MKKPSNKSIIAIISGACLTAILIFLFLTVLKIDANSFQFLWIESSNQNFLSNVLTIEAGLIGVAIPIALNIVTFTADRYKEPEITQYFTKEWIYRIQYFSILANIIGITYLTISEKTSVGAVWFFFCWFVLNICLFFLFIRLIEQYAVNIDKIIRRKLLQNAEEILG